ncbi:WhiB family transcriptional regulator [Candidatus Mycolicibacterium alkanivorans]|uniref:WhiB family transcriptional regulator n=1 Tax=Candidatus Mycolicibacterium alkanivorans TaxID=2954114 RepID=A0ABS9YV84_9MYCO|nr:WhiB family transcriptional regulator [Candidatus Mycolicibacterium alkanivorans]
MPKKSAQPDPDQTTRKQRRGRSFRDRTTRDGRLEPGWLHLLAHILSGTTRLPEAACKNHPHTFDGHSEESRNAAQAICSTCPALTPCQNWYTALRPTQRPAGVVAGQAAKHR